MNLAHHLVRAARLRPAAPAVAVGPDPLWGWGELLSRTARLAGGLRGALGLAPGERVALVMKNGPAYVELFYACWITGLAAVPVNAKLHRREFAYILDHSGARAAFVTPDLAEAVAGAAGDAGSPARLIDVGGAEYQRLLAADPIAVAETAATDLAWLFYTSGTTGRPKGAMLSHRNLLAMALSYFIDIDTIAPGDAIIHAAPLSHGSGLYMIPHVMGCATQVIPPSGGFEPAEILAAARRWPGLSMFAAPTMVKRLVDDAASATADTANLKSIIYGGAPMYVADLKAAIARFGFKLAQLYGQGESPMTITGMTKALIRDAYERGDDARLGSAGAPQSVVAVRVADEEDRPLPVGETGEILARGDSVMEGYWRDAEASARALRGGWLHTGDVGSFDADGFLTLKDRSKDVIISGGSNIYPREVEEVLLLHPAVAEVSVVGMADAEWGENVIAFVVCRAGASAPAEELDALCLDHIARFKRPKQYRFIDALPKNNYGKVLKTELRARLAQAQEGS